MNGTQTLTFPNARYLVRQAEWRKFEDPALSPISRTGVETALSLLAPKIEFIEDGQELVPGVQVQAAPGHTPGHAILNITEQGERLLIVGDAFHHVVGIDHPEWVDGIDEDPDQAIQTRRRLLQEMAQPHTRTSGIHLSPSAFGRLVTDPHGKLIWQADMT